MIVVLGGRFLAVYGSFRAPGVEGSYLEAYLEVYVGVYSYGLGSGWTGVRVLLAETQVCTGKCAQRIKWGEAK